MVNTQSDSSMNHGIILIILSGILYYIDSFTTCRACNGWDMLNPLCQMQFYTCTGSESIIHVGLFFASIILFTYGVIKILRGK